ncbi:MAG: YdiU family protein [Oscillatoriales cyanobacterium RM1_1_9]|nr:YdiU family protein [Oscillatoriales cyanobacterium SM2_3_0]NJO46580.1 YdiU family protein [Oscillatoriales cyanobacterium RM2_1_1]NJO71761.1 YdiU family protein [Oscillatoriales cyanobacterium RM1_1_9]
MANPFLFLDYESAFESLGKDYYDEVAATEFPHHILRFRNDPILVQLGLSPEAVTDDHWIEAFGRFESVRPCLAMCYHGHQFGEYNPYLGDGRGFLYGQVRGVDGRLYDFGTKGSGRTPYSRHADGRLTLKGGVREVLAGEALHRLGVRTSRCLSLIETGEQLWRGDEPSPTRAAVMVRFSHSHIRFGTFERLHYLGRKDLVEKLLDHVIFYYYPHLKSEPNRYDLFYEELVKRIAELVAQWMAAGFCHGVLNTDNIAITGESFDYGPYAFIPNYDLRFTAAYFDYGSLYCYGNQPWVCKRNLELLQNPLKMVIDPQALKLALDKFDHYYYRAYRQLIMNRLGFKTIADEAADELLKQTINLLKNHGIGYNEFFIALRQQFSPTWRDHPGEILSQAEGIKNFEGWRHLYLETWQQLYHHQLQILSPDDIQQIQHHLNQQNPETILLRSTIEAIWEPIMTEDNWQPFYHLIDQLRAE